MGASTAAGTIIVEVSGIGVAYMDHIALTVGDSVVWVRGNIVEELVDSISGGLGGCGLLGAYGAESDEKFVVNSAYVIQEGGEDNLDAFDADSVKWRARIGRCRLMGLGAVGDGGILVRG